MRVVWSPTAVWNLIQQREFLARDNPDAASRVAVRLLEAVKTLAEMPHMGRPGRKPGTRELVVSGTPYVIPYRIAGEELQIIAILHSAQKWPK